MIDVRTAQQRLKAAKTRKVDAARALQNVTNGMSVTQINELNAEFDEAEARLAGAERDLERAQAADGRTPAGSVRVNEKAVYQRGDPSRSYFADLYKAQRHNDAGALDRLRKSDAEARASLSDRGIEVRETGATAAAGFIPPIWMADEWAEFARPGRPVADRMPRLPLPEDGLTAHIPKVSTGLTEAAQTASGGFNDSVASADVSTTTADAALVTIAGQTDVDRQVLERSLPGLDMVLFDDLLRAYDAELDRQLLDGHTANAEHLGILNVSGINTITDNSGTTGSDLAVNIYKAASQIYSNRFVAPTAVYMHPRRAAWLAATQSQSAPILQVGDLYRAQGQQMTGLAASISGIPIVQDANVPTHVNYGVSDTSGSQDVVIVAYEPDFRLAEGDVRQATYEDVLSGKLAVRLQLFSFSFAWFNRQPKGITVIGGTLLNGPSGY